MTDRAPKTTSRTQRAQLTRNTPAKGYLYDAPLPTRRRQTRNHTKHAHVTHNARMVLCEASLMNRDWTKRTGLGEVRALKPRLAERPHRGGWNRVKGN